LTGLPIGARLPSFSILARKYDSCRGRMGRSARGHKARRSAHPRARFEPSRTALDRTERRRLSQQRTKSSRRKSASPRSRSGCRLVRRSCGLHLEPIRCQTMYSSRSKCGSSELFAGLKHQTLMRGSHSRDRCLAFAPQYDTHQACEQSGRRRSARNRLQMCCDRHSTHHATASGVPRALRC
jgi:hypothetical protein